MKTKNDHIRMAQNRSGKSNSSFRGASKHAAAKRKSESNDPSHAETENEKYWRERVEYADTHDDGSDEPWSTPY